MLYASSGAPCPAFDFLVRIPSVRRVLPCRCCHIVYQRGYCFLYCLNSGCRAPFVLCRNFPGSFVCSPLLQTALNYVHAVLAIGLPIFFFPAPGHMTRLGVVPAPSIGSLSVSVCLAWTLAMASVTVEGKRSTCLLCNNGRRLRHL